MVTKKDLLLEDEQVELEIKKRQKVSEDSTKDFLKNLNKNANLRAKTLVEGELGDAIKQWNRDKHKYIKLEEYRAFDKSGREIRGEFRLDINLILCPNAMKILVKDLKKAGFEAHVQIDQEQNYEYFTTADGYDTRDLPGKHPVHYLIIDWS